MFGYFGDILEEVAAGGRLEQAVGEKRRRYRRDSKESRGSFPLERGVEGCY